MIPGPLVLPTRLSVTRLPEWLTGLWCGGLFPLPALTARVSVSAPKPRKGTCPRDCPVYQEMSPPEHLAQMPPDNDLELFLTPPAFRITAECLLMQFLSLPSRTSP